MSDRIAAAEAILATVATARGRMAHLAHAHLPFDRALALELAATVGASPERAQLELFSELVDRRVSLWRQARGATAPAQEPTRHSLPISTAPTRRRLDAEDIGDEATPMSGPSLLSVPSQVIALEPEHEVTAAQVEATLPSLDGQAEVDQDALREEDELVLLGPQDQISQTDPDIPFGDHDHDNDDDIEAVLLEEALADELDAALDDELDDDVEAAFEEDNDEEQAPLIDEEPPAHDVEDLQPASPVGAEQADEQAETPERVDETEDAAQREEEEDEPPTSFDHLVRFVDPTPRRAPELLFEEPLEDVTSEEPVAEEATIQDAVTAQGQLLEEDLEDDLLDEAVEAALDDEPSVATTIEGFVIDASRPLDDEPAPRPATSISEDPTPLGRFSIYEDGGTEDGGTEDGGTEDGGTEEGDVVEEEPPVLAPPQRHAPSMPAMVSASEIDEERTLHGVPVLTDADLADEPAPPPRRDPARGAAPVQIQPVQRRPDAASTLEIDASDAESVDDEGSPEPAAASSFSVTLERPNREDDEEESVYDLGAEDQSGAPRLTDEDDGYTVSPGEDSGPSQPAFDPALAAEFLQKARDAEARGDLAKAIVHYQDLLDLTPESLDAYLGRGRCFMEMGDYAAAMSDFQRAEDLDGKSPEPLVEMGNLFFARKEYRRAIEFYDQAIDIDPTHAMARCRRGICHHYRKNHKQAFQDLQRAYSLNPEIPNIRKYVQMAVKAMEKSR